MARAKRIFSLSLVVITALLSPLSLAADVSQTDGASRPKIGLALSGGGAKGAAHVGVLKYLESHNIPVDYIAGTSMGAYVGGLYAMGISPHEIDRMLSTYDWGQGYNDDVDRALLSVREKHRQDNFQLQTQIGFNDKQIEIPSGYVQGQGMAKLLRLSTRSLPPVADFDDLPIPYRAVATDIETMQPVILDHGDLAKVMQASMSIPGVLVPVEIEGKMLVDGGMVNNLPVSVLKEMGADIIIAVDIGSQLSTLDQLSSAFAILDQLSNHMTRTSADREIATLTEQDILLMPDINGIGVADFDRMPEAVLRGEKAAVDKAVQLAPLSLSRAEYLAYLQSKTERTASLNYSDDIIVDALEINTDTKLSPEVIESKIDLHVGDELTIAQLEEKIDRLYALNIFQKVDYSILNTEGRNTIRITAKEKTWGPGYVDFKFNAQESTTRDDNLQIGLQYVLTDLNKLGAEWRSELIFGSHSVASTEFYTPIDYDHNFFYKVGATVESLDSKVYTSAIYDPGLGGITDDFEFLQIETTQSTLYTELGIAPANWAELSLGWRYARGENDGIGTTLESRFNSQQWYLKMRLDSLDNISFPTSGFKVDADVIWDDGEYLDEDSRMNNFYNLDVRKAFSVGRGSLELKASVTSYEGKPLSPTFLVGLGGFQNLSGYGIDELTGKYKAFGALVYHHKILDNNFGAFSLPLYVGGSIEQGNVWQDKDDISYSSVLTAGSMFFGVDTGIGPVVLAYGLAEGGAASGYLFIGNNF